jgi:hypothetical protein
MWMQTDRKVNMTSELQTINVNADWQEGQHDLRIPSDQCECRQTGRSTWPQNYRRFMWMQRDRKVNMTSELQKIHVNADRQGGQHDLRITEDHCECRQTGRSTWPQNYRRSLWMQTDRKVNMSSEIQMINLNADRQEGQHDLRRVEGQCDLSRTDTKF